jgi:RNA polymerase sigma-70 factor (ECF subfamily)
MEAEDFRTLLRRVRAGDAEAAEELVRQYEPAIRRFVRLRLTDPRLRRFLDSMDVCQSVLANFFVRAAAGQFELDSPEQLLALLATMARHRVLDHARDNRAARRDNRRLEAGGDGALQGVADAAETPSQAVAARDLLGEVRRRLRPEERRLMELRAEGRPWAEIAASVGGSPEALRKTLERGVRRVSAELGLDEVDDV